MASNSSPVDKIVIVGAGCFGLSTALHLLRDGYKSVTVLDRALVLPAVDGSSVDINRIVRSSYEDPFYSSLARKAIKDWKDTVTWSDSYHESGVLVLGSRSYNEASYRNDKTFGARLNLYDESPAKDFDALYDRSARSGYFNYDGGWADAQKGIEQALLKVKELGGEVYAGKTVKGLLKTPDGSRTCGVECSDGSVYNADLVVMATGAWTASAVPELSPLASMANATGQCVAMVQLTPEEQRTYQGIPVALNFGNGFYCFPPTASGLVKIAIHGAGYTHTHGHSHVSKPRTLVTDGDDGLRIPSETVQELRLKFSQVFPELAKKPFVKTRLCWYTDTPDGNWLIGRHPDDQGLFVATGGSGHAYKFLPVIGGIVSRAMQGTLEPEIVQKFAVDRSISERDGSREMMPLVKELDLNSLCTPQDLVATQ